MLKGSKKPNVPMEKLSTGGTELVLNNEDAWRIVPSPPSVTTKSMGLLSISDGVQGRSVGGICAVLSW